MAETKTTPRLELGATMTWSDVFKTMVKPKDGEEFLNGGAMDCLIQLSTYRGTSHAIDSVFWLDKMGIHDDDLGTFWLEICQRRWDAFDTYINHFRQGFITKEEIHQKLAEFRHSA